MTKILAGLAPAVGLLAAVLLGACEGTRDTIYVLEPVPVAVCDAGDADVYVQANWTGAALQSWHGEATTTFYNTLGTMGFLNLAPHVDDVAWDDAPPGGIVDASWSLDVSLPVSPTEASALYVDLDVSLVDGHESRLVLHALEPLDVTGNTLVGAFWNTRGTLPSVDEVGLELSVEIGDCTAAPAAPCDARLPVVLLAGLPGTEPVAIPPGTSAWVGGRLVANGADSGARADASCTNDPEIWIVGYVLPASVGT